MNQWTSHHQEYLALLEDFRRIASGEGLTLNPDTERLEKVAGLMTENLVLTGARFCPCKQSHPLNTDTDTTCPCPEWKEEIESTGHCFCRLFYRRDSS